MRQGMLALMMPVTTFAEAALGGDDEVDAGGAGELGDAGDAHFDIGRRGLHEVGQLVDEHHDVGKRSGISIVIERRGGLVDPGASALLKAVAMGSMRSSTGGSGRFGGEPVLLRAGAGAVVEGIDVAHAFLGEDAGSAFHLVDQPLEGGPVFLGSVTTGMSMWGSG
jgi:hypothetical protein